MDWDRRCAGGAEAGSYVFYVRIFVAVLVVGLTDLISSSSLNTILIRNAAPSSEALGSTFGLAQTVACVARAGSPAFVRFVASQFPFYASSI